MKRTPVVLATAAAVLASGVLAAPASTATTKRVEVGDDFFSPKRLTVSKGTVVRWRWVGEAPHDVKVVKGPVKFASKVQTEGSYKRTLKRRGTYRIVCTIHQGMAQTIRVR